MKIKILASASQDLIDGYWFYEKQAEGLGIYFLDSLFSDIDSLIINAGIHPLYFGKYHRMLSKRFPFAVYYRVENNTALVYGVLDCRRSPAWIKKKLK
ncbi:MAG: hypothetical protein CV087_04445 [Candidatus Brocadia sp. WS118]|nr:MAG: hypothetical protein CV087_04445 [Candidatus Brocadia sp. WS118]